MKKILVVEGKNGAQRSVVGALNRTGQYIVLVSNDAVQAVSVMKDTRCDLLVTGAAIKQDHDGLSLIQFARANGLVPEALILSPGTEPIKAVPPGVLVCPSPDLDCILRFVAEGLAELQLKKPADWQHEIKTVFQGSLELPTISEVRLKVLRMTADHRNPFEEAAVADVARVIELDAPLSLRVIPVANRVPKSGVVRITSILPAVTRLGLKEVHNLASAAAFVELFRDAPLVIGFDMVGFWHHAIACAAVVQMLANGKKQFAAEDSHTVFTAGILHDIGTLALARFMPDLFRDILRLARRKRWAVQAAEKEVCGLTHMAIGGYLAQRLPLPEVLAAAIKLHHSGGSRSAGEAAKVAQIANLVHVGDVLAAQIGFPSGGDAVMPDFNPEVLKMLKLTLEDIEDLKPKATRRAKELIAMLPLHET